VTVRDSYCAMPFSAVTVNPTGEVRPCCRFSGIMSRGGDVSAALHSATNDRVRADMLAGLPVKECVRCTRVENSGARSLRNFANERLGRPTNVKLRSLEIGFSNLCNMTCRTCSSRFSTRWRTEEQKLGIGPALGHIKSGVPIDELDLSELSFLKVYGGEPMLHQDEFISLLERVDHDGNIGALYVDIATNGTILPNKILASLLSRCRIVRLQYSLDAVGRLSDYIRTGSSWDILVTNFQFMKNELKYEAFINTVPSVLNVNCLDVLDNFLRDEFPGLYQNYDVADHPAALAIHNLPDNVKHTLTQKLSGRDWGSRSEQYGKVMAALARPSESMPDCAAYIRNLDIIRGENFANVNPEMAELLGLRS